MVAPRIPELSRYSWALPETRTRHTTSMEPQHAAQRIGLQLIQETPTANTLPQVPDARILPNSRKPSGDREFKLRFRSMTG